MTATDKQHVDPELWPLVDAFPPIDVSAATLPAFRQAMIDLSVLPDAATHPDVRVETVQVPGEPQSAATIRCLLFTPDRKSGGALLHVHGGGFVMGSPEMDVARNIALARATGCTILSVDYRLAPEHPHPAGLLDCHAALVWLASRADASRSAPRRVGVIGESAGGGLAAALALLARDRGTVPLACQVLIYPMLMPPSRSLDNRVADTRTGRHIWSRASNDFGWSSLLAGGTVDTATIAGLATSLAGLPPTFMAVGELDLFVHDLLAHSARLLAAGCTVEAHLYPGAIHGFDRMVEAAVSRRFTADLSAFVSRHLG